MELTGQQRIEAPIDRTWIALNDPGVLKACIAGCETIDRVSDTDYTIGMAVRIGPVNAKFKGKLKLENLTPPSAYSIAFEGQGGVAGFGKGKADVKLTPDGGATILDYTAHAQVGGKIAQVGSRLVDSAARKMAEDFFAAFNAQIGTKVPEPEAAAAAAGAAGAAESGPPARPGIPAWVWIAGTIVAIAVIAWLAR
jgi:carbon monoxide dehydrogenase subunit G